MSNLIATWAPAFIVTTGDNGASYFDFSTLPGNERYYELDKGPAHFVFLDSDKAREPDGTSPASTQGLWAQAAIAASAAPFQFVVFHHPAYTSGDRTADMDWPFKTWGVDAVITGHVHNYERLRSPATGLQYFVNGQGGVTTHGFGPSIRRASSASTRRTARRILQFAGPNARSLPGIAGRGILGE